MSVNRCRSASTIAADLELEESVAVSRDDFLQRFRQAVIHLSRVTADDIDETYGVARGDAVRGRQLREKARHIETGKIGQLIGKLCRIDAGAIGLHQLAERYVGGETQRVENGAVDLRRAEIGGERVEALAATGFDLFGVMGGEMTEGGARMAVGIGARRKPERQAQLLEICLRS